MPPSFLYLALTTVFINEHKLSASRFICLDEDALLQRPLYITLNLEIAHVAIVSEEMASQLQ